jgi:Flp pilus assembly protein TadG
MSRDRADQEEGALLIEFALVVPVLLLLISAIVDLGLGWRRSNEVAATLRSTARVEARLGAVGTVDYEALTTLGSSANEFGHANIQRIIVYQSKTSDGAVPAECTALTASASGTGVNTSTVKCNVYSRSQLDSLSAASFTAAAATSCTSTSWDRWYCPVIRESKQNAVAGADYVGVWMEVDYRFVVGALTGTGITIKDKAVVRLEPPLS